MHFKFIEESFVKFKVQLWRYPSYSENTYRGEISLWLRPKEKKNKNQMTCERFQSEIYVSKKVLYPMVHVTRQRYENESLIIKTIHISVIGEK